MAAMQQEHNQQARDKKRTELVGFAVQKLRRAASAQRELISAENMMSTAPDPVYKHRKNAMFAFDALSLALDELAEFLDEERRAR